MTAVGARSVKVPDLMKARMIAAYPTISGITQEFLEWHATPEEREEAWNRIVAVQNMRDILDATYPAGWSS